jgi:site-specific DNA-methyltransferase (adenine-specific)
MVIGRQDYNWRHEPCLLGWKDGAAHYWGNDRCQTTVLEFDRPSRSVDHPPTQPTAWFSYQINNSGRQEGIVLDSVCGSGTTVLACEQTGRTARAVELDPKYCDVIRRRYAEHVHGPECDWAALTPAV